MSTDLIVALIVIPAVVFAGWLGYWGGHDAGRRESNARHRDIAAEKERLYRRRLDQVLNERDAAIDHAEQATLELTALMESMGARIDHPSLVVIEGGAS